MSLSINQGGSNVDIWTFQEIVNVVNEFKNLKNPPQSNSKGLQFKKSEEPHEDKKNPVLNSQYQPSPHILPEKKEVKAKNKLKITENNKEIFLGQKDLVWIRCIGERGRKSSGFECKNLRYIYL